MTHEQIALVINNYFKFDTTTGKLASWREQFSFCTYIYWHHLENLSYQTHAKHWALKSSCKGTFSTKQLCKIIDTCSVLRVKENPVIKCYESKCFNYRISYKPFYQRFGETVIHLTDLRVNSVISGSEGKCFSYRILFFLEVIVKVRHLECPFNNYTNYIGVGLNIFTQDYCIIKHYVIEGES